MGSFCLGVTRGHIETYNKDNGEKEGKDEILGEIIVFYFLFNCSTDLLRNVMRVDLEATESSKRRFSGPM